jgi:CO dehydrogenase/acetyl-CoA synthase alpha subunit
MSLLALYTACCLLPLLFLIALAVGLLSRGRGEVMLCTECQSCVTHCPARDKGANAFQGMLWAKTGSREEDFYRELDAACVRCGKCRADCPRGLAPFALLPERGRDGE